MSAAIIEAALYKKYCHKCDLAQREPKV